MADKRQLLLLRHGKAEHSSAIRDIDRSLTPRGHKDVPAIARCAVERGFVPELILCSPAARARQTAELFCESLPAAIDIAYVDTLYLASAEEILDNVAAAPEECRSLMVVGHNKGLEDLSMKLAGKAFPHDSLPTGTLAVFDVDASNWSPIERKNCRLIDFLRPKALRAKGK